MFYVGRWRVRVFFVLVCFILGISGLNLTNYVYADSSDNLVNINITTTEHQITLDWINKTYDGLTYEIKRDGNVITTIYPSDEPIIYDRNLVSNTTYNYQIVKLDTNGETLVYNADITTAKDITPPTITEPATDVNPNTLIFDGNGTLYKDGVAYPVNSGAGAFGYDQFYQGDGSYTLVVTDDVGDEISKSFIFDTTPPAHAQLTHVQTEGDYAYLTFKRPSDEDFSKMEIYRGDVDTEKELLKVITKDQFSKDGTFEYLQQLDNLTVGPITLNVVSYDTHGNKDSSTVQSHLPYLHTVTAAGVYFIIPKSTPVWFTSPTVKSIQQTEGGFTITLDIPAGTSSVDFSSNLGFTEIEGPFSKETTRVLKFPLSYNNKTTPVPEACTLKYEFTSYGYVNVPVRSPSISKPVDGSYNYNENNFRLESPKFLQIINKHGAVLYKDKALKLTAKKAPVNARFIVINEDSKYTKISDGVAIYYVKKSDVKIMAGLNQKKTAVAAITLKAAMSSSSHTVGTISKNNQVILLQRYTGWYYVNSGGKLGYVQSKYLK